MAGGVGVEDVQRRQGERCQWLVEGEVALQLALHGDGAAVGSRRRDPLQHTGIQQAAAEGDGSTRQPGLAARGLVVVAQEVAQRAHGVAGTLHDVEDHGVVDAHP